MKVLLTQYALVNPGGSEFVALEVAIELVKQGHEVSVYTMRLGKFASAFLPNGVRAVDSLAQVPWKPDIIHGQHHLPAMAAIARFDDVPAVYHCHGSTPWLETPPMHVNIRRYIMMCAWMIKRSETAYDLKPERIACVPNFVNTVRFSEVRQPPRQLKRALLFGGGGLPRREVALLAEACSHSGLRLDKIGASYRNVHTRPELVLQNYDLVFAIGKSAIEAMASGCAVITLAPGQAGSLVTTENFNEVAFTNFSPRHFKSSALLGKDWLAKQLAGYSAEDAAKVTRKVRDECTLTLAVEHIARLHQEVCREGIPHEEAPFAPYLDWLTRDVSRVFDENEKLRKRLKAPLLRQLFWRLSGKNFAGIE